MQIASVLTMSHLKRDADDLALLVNGFGSVPTRLGGSKPSYSELVGRISHGDISSYSALTTYTQATNWVEVGGLVYRPIPSQLPIGPEAFNSAKWIVVQDNLGPKNRGITLLFNSLDSLLDESSPGNCSPADGRIINLADLIPTQQSTAQVVTSEYRAGTRIGGSNYTLKTLAQHRIDLGKPTWVPDGKLVNGRRVGGDHYVGGGTTYVVVLNVFVAPAATQFGALPDYYLPDDSVNPTPTDNAPSIQACIDYGAYVRAYLPRRFDQDRTGYAHSDPIYLGYGEILAGHDDTNVELIKTTNNLGTGTSTHPDGTVFNYAVDAGIIKINPPGSSALGQGVQKLKLLSTVQSQYGIYASYMSKTHDCDVSIVGYKEGYYAYDQFLCTMDRIWVRNDNYQRAEYGFRFHKGTSLNMNGCWAKYVERGYELGQLQYSTLDTACDNFTHFAYNGGSSITYVSPGAEEAHLVEGGFVFGGGARQISIDGGGILGSIDCDLAAVNASFFNFQGTQVTITGYRLPNLAANCADRMDLFKLAGDAKVTFRGGVLPADSKFRELVTHETEYSALKIDAGSGEIIYTKLQTPVFVGAHQYKHSALKFGNDAVMGLPTDDAAKPLSAANDLLINVYYVSEIPTAVLTLSNPSGNYNFTVILDCYILGQTNSTYIKGIIQHVSGTGSGVTTIISQGPHTVVAAWEGNTLMLSVGGGATQGIMELRVKVRESNGGPKIVWAS